LKAVARLYDQILAKMLTSDRSLPVGVLLNSENAVSFHTS